VVCSSCFPGRQQEHSGASKEELYFLRSEEFRRKLDEELERVYQIEYEAKQKLLSEQKNTWYCVLIKCK
jgi:hypothetical protein